MSLKRRHGAKYVVLYLKASQLAVQKFIAGTPVSSLKELMGDMPCRRLDSRGLPMVIPFADRKLIAAGSASITRCWLTLFSVYRVIRIPGTLKLSTITDNLSVPDINLVIIGSQLADLAKGFSYRFPEIDQEDSELLFIEKASPSHKTSWIGMF